MPRLLCPPHRDKDIEIADGLKLSLQSFLPTFSEATENFIQSVRIVQRFLFADHAPEVANDPGFKWLQMRCSAGRELSDLDVCERPIIMMGGDIVEHQENLLFSGGIRASSQLTHH